MSRTDARSTVALALTALLMSGCGSGDGRSDSSALRSTDTTGAPVTPAAPSRPEAAREIYIDSVEPGNPLVVRGRARTFENTVQVLARDAAGNVITEVFTTSVGEMGNHNPYEAQVWLVRDPGPRFTLEAFEYSANDGSVRSLVSRPMSAPTERMSVTLMFPTSDCTTTKPFTRTLPRAVGVAQLLMHALVAGPTAEEKSAGAVGAFPAGARVKSVILRDGVVTVDFNERLQNVGGACAASAIRAAVSATLTRLPGVQRVVITAGGSEPLALQP
jgi:hypothetical protein